MTTTDIAALARAAGLAGREWNSWCCDDAVQSYVDERGAAGADVNFDAERDA